MLTFSINFHLPTWNRTLSWSEHLPSFQNVHYYVEQISKHSDPPNRIADIISLRLLKLCYYRLCHHIQNGLYHNNAKIQKKKGKKYENQRKKK
jgi:hypothetical protein